MKTVAILGSKGGCGKSTLSSFLAHGMSSGVEEATGKKIWTILLRTDNRTKKATDLIDKRKFYLASVPGNDSDEEYIMQVVEMSNQIPGSFLVVDGGANRRVYDFAACHIADLILLPTGSSEEDVETAQSDYEELSEYIETNGLKTEIYIVRHKWPGVQSKLDFIMKTPWAQKYVKKWTKAGILFPYIIPDMPSFLYLNNGNDPKSTLLLNKLSTKFAQVIGMKVGIDLGTDEGGGEDGSASASAGEAASHPAMADVQPPTVAEEPRKVA
ncbi:hypothetical protein [Rhizobium leguminosarum]|uniref:hypothetical protein n=1 Tax=Rhizobium leguminosarum TaxID=384 RepID=UPI002E11C7D8|nr:hypothetical protein U8Q02_38185 [Rhizobium leguminosarum]